MRANSSNLMIRNSPWSRLDHCHYSGGLMGLDRLFKLALVLTLAAAATGHLPDMIRTIHVAQLRLLQQSKASRWGSPDLFASHPPSTRTSR